MQIFYNALMFTSYCKLSLYLRWFAAISLGGAVVCGFMVDDDFTVATWLLIVVSALFEAFFIFGLAKIVDAAHIYIKQHTPEEEEEY